ncbi:MAG: MvaI/BcnI restriction endonuclease family protein, partial [Clostridia bacterium]|nr:MvaI/BcnI restriction endonuclease family protein [Clostridia bacterium]
MLLMSDTNIEQFIPIFANTGVSVAFLVPTPTGYGKSIMDATVPVRELLRNADIHNYETQNQGPENKILIPSYFVHPDKLQETVASLYRPLTKKGDPRIWFSKLTHYCEACNLLALVVVERKIFVINLSNPSITESLFKKEFVYDVLMESVYQNNLIARELLHKIQLIHNQGFIPSVTRGDPGVGDTLEHALGISRNN